MHSITVPTYEGWTDLEVVYSAGDFAITKNEGELVPFFYTITHLPSGCRLPSISYDGGETVAIHVTVESCQDFLRSVLDVLRPGDIAQDDEGNWKINPAFIKAYHRLVKMEFGE